LGLRLPTIGRIWSSSFLDHPAGLLSTSDESVGALIRAGLEPAQTARHIPRMKDHPPPELEMTIEGEFVEPRSAPIANRILLWAIVVAVLAGALSIAALALWFALMILPVAVGAGAVAYGVYRYRLWRMQSALSGQRNLWRRS